MGDAAQWFLRVTTLALMICATAVIIYTVVTDGSPLRKELLTPWMAATLVDFYTNVTLKMTKYLRFRCGFYTFGYSTGKQIGFYEFSGSFSSLYLEGSIHIVHFTYSASPMTCLYVAIQLFQLKPGEPVFKILLRKGDYYNPIPKRNGDH